MNILMLQSSYYKMDHFWKRSSRILILISIAALTDSGYVRDYCHVSPQAAYDPSGITGRWYLIEWTIPSYLCGTPETDTIWDVGLNHKTGSLKIKVSARYSYYPFACARYVANLAAFNNPGTYRRRSTEVILQADQIIADTDYSNYLIVYGCIPRLQKGCEDNVLVFGRKPFTGDKGLLEHLHGIISKKLCVDIKRLKLNLYSPLGAAECHKSGGY